MWLPGTYDEQVVISNALTLVGAGSSTIIKPSSAAKLTQVFDGLFWYGIPNTKQIAGIIVANAPGGEVTLKNLKVDESDITTKPVGADYLVGVFYRETGGTIDTVTVAGTGAWSGYDRAYGMYLSAANNTVSIEMKGSTITNFDKNGIEVMGNKLTANINHNTITGRGPTLSGDEVQNGVSVSRNATATVAYNSISNMAYVPEEWWAAGILFHEASGSADNNTIANCQMGIMYQDAGGTAQGNTVNGGTVGILGLWAQYLKAGTQTVSFAGNTVTGIKDSHPTHGSVPHYEGAAIGTQTYKAGASITLTIDGNQLSGGSTDADGIYVGDATANGPAGTVTATISDNVISGWLSGINLASSIAGNSAIRNNSIAANTKAVNNQTAALVDASSNWWGSSSGPFHPTANPSGTGNAVSNNVNFDPWVGKGVAATATRTVTASQTSPVSFNDAKDTTAVSLKVTGASGTLSVLVSRQTDSPQNPSGIIGYVSPYRWIIEKFGFTTPFNAEIRFNISQIPNHGITDPNSAIIYRRPTPGSGTFTALTTIYDSSRGELVASGVTSFSEFVIGSSNNFIPITAQRLLGVSGNNQSAPINTSLQAPLVVRVADTVGNLVQGTAVRFTVESFPPNAEGHGLSVVNATTGANGEASTVLTLGNKIGTYVVSATAVGLSGSPILFTAAATHGPAAALVLISGDGQSGIVRSELKEPFIVTVADAGGNAVSGASVTFAIGTTPPGATGQSLSTTSATTSDSGRASTTLTLGSRVGTYTVTATSGSLAGSPVTFTATATMGSAANITLTSGNSQRGTIKSVLADPFVVTVVDVWGNAVRGEDVTFAISTVPAGATGQSLSVTNATTDANGQATSILTLGHKVGTYMVTATSAGMAGSPVTFTATATLGAISKIIVNFGTNQRGKVHTLLTVPFSVVVVDAGDNPIPHHHVQFGIVSTPPGATGYRFDPLYVATDDRGVAESYFRLGNKPGTYVVSAKALGLTDSVIFSATALAGPAGMLTVVSGNGQSGDTGRELASPFVVLVKDTSGNPVPEVTVRFTISSIPAGTSGHSLSATSVATDSLGQAWTRLTLGSRAGDYVVTATCDVPTVAPVRFTATAISPATGVESVSSTAPTEYILHNAYPNPFNPSTHIRFGLPEQSDVRIEVYSVLGNKVAELVNEELQAGRYEVVWRADHFSAGSYLVRMTARSRVSEKQFNTVRKVMLVK